MKHEDNILIGKRVLAVHQTANNKVAFDTDSGTVILEMIGDCCSSAYVYGIEGDIVGEVVTAVDSNVRDDSQTEESVLEKIKSLFGSDGIQDYQSIWSVDVYSGSKRLRVLHCNSSNGYYDSWPEWSTQ